MEANGIPTVVANKNVDADSSVNIRTFIYRLNDDMVMHISFLTMAGGSTRGAEVIESMGRSFRRLSDAEIAAFKPRRIKIIAVGPKDTLASMADRMAFDDYQLARFKALNGIESQADLMSSGRVKIVTYDVGSSAPTSSGQSASND